MPAQGDTIRHPMILNISGTRGRLHFLSLVIVPHWRLLGWKRSCVHFSISRENNGAIKVGSENRPLGRIGDSMRDWNPRDLNRGWGLIGVPSERASYADTVDDD